MPMIIGAGDMIFPRLNNLRFWFLPGALFLLLLSTRVEGGAGTGWTLYPPLSSYLGHRGPAVDMVIFSIHLSGLSSIFSSINFACTIKDTTVHALKGERMPPFVWGVAVARGLLILAMPVLAGAVTMLLMDRNFNTTFYDPGGGGDPVLFEHLF